MIQSIPDPSYETATEHLDDFGQALARLIQELLSNAGVAVHSIDYRVKKYDSASRKLARGADRYSGIADLKDLLGVRVITYFPNEVDDVAGVLTPEFTIDEGNSIDKRSILDADRFGYLSLHYVAEMLPSRVDLVEYRRFKGRCFELQIRSILQHAWAEIEHDLGYKASGSLPRDARRRFSRLAGLLELADDEFARLRHELGEYEDLVDQNIATTPERLELNQSTLQALLREPRFLEMDWGVAKAFGVPLRDEIDPDYLSRLASDLRLFGVRDVATFLRVVEWRGEHALRFAQIWLSDEEDQPLLKAHNTVARGIYVWYLNYTLLATSDESRRTAWAEQESRKFAREPDFMPHIDKTWERVTEELGQPGAE